MTRSLGDLAWTRSRCSGTTCTRQGRGWCWWVLTGGPRRGGALRPSPPPPLLLPRDSAVRAALVVSVHALSFVCFLFCPSGQQQGFSFSPPVCLSRLLFSFLFYLLLARGVKFFFVALRGVFVAQFVERSRSFLSPPPAPPRIFPALPTLWFVALRFAKFRWCTCGR